ncbi:MAG: ArsS family sensor histidine kinase [Sulfuricurvum sp.]|nr:ArsS family sensor histidine kinase [Sulfuricurvum sp.]MDD5386319.1 ArsS family sensor histidine kinase [Sulfuricurvum sp.]
MIFRRNAVLLTVLFALAVTVGSVSYTFYQLYQTNRAKHTDNLFSKYSLISQIYNTFLLKQISLPILEANLAVYDLYVVNDAGYKSVTQQALVLKEEGQSVSQHISFEAPYNDLIVSQVYARMLQFNGKIYFWIQSDHHSILLEDRKVQGYDPSYLLYAYGTILLILLFSFGLIIIRIAPLRRLRRQIARFGEGDMGVRFHANGEDEIALIANELETAQSKIRSLIESRTLFLRNIMHELKTPIAKGRIVTTMIEDEKQRGRFVSIFERLEGLIGEFALIEEISSGSQYLDKKEYRLIDIIDGAIDSAMVEYDSVDSNVDASVKIEVDYRLFVTAIKNLIDNGIKYSPEKKMSIFMENDEIFFANLGEPLKKPLSHYIEPFTKDQPTKDSFGLGLYIVDAILREHGYVLAYERRDTLNCFIFVPIKPKKK